MKLLDLFAGTGVGVAAQMLGIEEHGIEKMPEAIATRDANGMTTIYEDVLDFHLLPDVIYELLWGSPPCQPFSTTGGGSGNRGMPAILDAIQYGDWQTLDGLDALADRVGDERAALVLVPLHYIFRLAPRGVALEQVPAVLPVWEGYAEVLRRWGYSVWTGVLDAGQYGVPQSRKRAYLIARNDDIQAAPPLPTDSPTLASIRPDQEGLVSNYSDTGRGGIAIPGNKKPRGYRRIDKQAFTATSKVMNQRWYPSMENVSEREAKMIQSYPEDFVFTGKAGLQIGNAVPPLMAKAVLETFL